MITKKVIAIAVIVVVLIIAVLPISAMNHGTKNAGAEIENSVQTENASQSLSNHTESNQENRGSGQNESSTNMNSDRSGNEVVVTVKSVSNWTQAGNRPAPSEGNKYIVLTMSIENDMDEDLDLSPNLFRLDTSGGQMHTYSWRVNYTMPDGVQSKSTVSVTLGFEISTTSTPIALHFDTSSLDIKTVLPGVSGDIVQGSDKSSELPDVVVSVIDVSNWVQRQNDPNPRQGDKYVLLTVNIQNNMNETLDLSSNYLKLDTSDGQFHRCSRTVGCDIPESVQARSNVTMKLGFEVSSSVTLEVLHFDNNIQKAEVSF